MRYNSNYNKVNSKWNWWDIPLGIATGGISTALKGAKEAYDANAEKEKEENNRIGSDELEEYLRKKYPDASDRNIEQMYDYITKSKEFNEKDGGKSGYDPTEIDNWTKTYYDSTEGFSKDVTVGLKHEGINLTEEQQAQDEATEQALEEKEDSLQAQDEAASLLAEQEAQQAASTSAVQAQNAGINKARAGMSGTDVSTNRSNINNALAGQAASTQQDYLNKMGQANAMNQQANNMQTGALLNTISGMITGAGSGAQAGNAMFGTSDENEKAPVEEPSKDEILEAAQRLMDLYKQLQELKKENK